MKELEVAYVRELVPVSDIINDANPSSHMSADYIGDPKFYHIIVYPPKVYEVIRKLKEQQLQGEEHATSADSRVGDPEEKSGA